MKLSHIPGNIAFPCGHTAYTFLSTGDIYCFRHKNIMINGFIGSKLEGSANNIWLRIYQDAEDLTNIRFYPLLGIRSSSRLVQYGNCLKYMGKAEDISYEVTFIPADTAWFWEISLTGEGQKADIIYGQDLGMADQSALLENELYAAQYLGHTILENENGFHIGSRQNLPQSTGHPFLQQGLLNAHALSYSTDALQFFGLSYKADQIPAALLQGLPGKKLQFENSFAALQTEPFSLNGTRRIVFYGCFQEHHPDQITQLEHLDELTKVYSSFSVSGSPLPLPPVEIRFCFGEPFSSPKWAKEDISSLYPKRLQEEYEGDTLLSFFTPDYAHVVFQQKELLTERPHGNIITTAASTDHVNENLITSTNYIHGFFNGQTVIGNTSRHKFTSASRGLMNLLKNSGQRIWIRLCGRYRLLVLPALFETGLNYARWFYQLEEDILRITVFAAAEETKIITEVESLKGLSYDFIVTNQLVLGTHEFTSPVILEKLEEVLRFYPENSSSSPYPGLHYDLYSPDASYTFSDDRIFFQDNEPQNTTLLSVLFQEKSRFQLVIEGSLEEGSVPLPKSACFRDEKQYYLDYYNKFLNGFYLEMSGQSQRDAEKLNLISRWYAHNALIHFAVPHGLEQPGGAAWGTRDVCQGPMELFLSTGNFALARDVLCNIFSHQSSVSGEWAQWFMFDRYPDHFHECHGDVVFWPLKCVGDYISASGDFSILDQELPFIDAPSCRLKTLSEHVKLSVEAVTKRFLPGTRLISYAGGDWDDTLQPADESLKENLVSSWTQALAYQVLELLRSLWEKRDPAYSLHLKVLADHIREDFCRYLVIDGVIAGFVYRNTDGSFTPMLHPKDSKTGIHLRLLPLTRSILAGLADEKQAVCNLKQIEEHLHFPDGVRLMDRPAPYNGGVCHLFKRAEQAANVGREISLQYTHAHIRYLEALCRVGRHDDVWNALFQITPVNLRDSVPHAAYRQRNLYFSSSEGAFADRYDYAENFHRLSDGSIQVKGGWRIYSSGPGIYMNRLICDILGIRITRNSLILCPTLPERMDGLRFSYRCFGQDFVFVYHISRGAANSIRALQNQRQLAFRPVPGKYRRDAISICEKDLDTSCREIHIFTEYT